MILQYLGIGIYHAQRDLPCQDFVLARRLRRSGLTVLALADGAGSAEYARLAARLNCGAVVSFFGKMNTEAAFADFLALPEAERAQQILTHCRRVIGERMQRERCEKASAFSATLLFAAIGREQVLIGHLGDGAIYCREGESLSYSPGENRNGMKNATYFTVSRDAEEHLRMTTLPREGVSSLLLSSDGTSGLFRGGQVPLSLMQAAENGQLPTNRALQEALRDVVEVPILRADDWSVLLWTANEPDAVGETVTEPVDMLAEEQEKFRQELEAAEQELEATEQESEAAEQEPEVTEQEQEPEADEQEPEHEEDAYGTGKTETTHQGQLA